MQGKKAGGIWNFCSISIIHARLYGHYRTCTFVWSDKSRKNFTHTHTTPVFHEHRDFSKPLSLLSVLPPPASQHLLTPLHLVGWPPEQQLLCKMHHE